MTGGNAGAAGGLGTESGKEKNDVRRLASAVALLAVVGACGAAGIWGTDYLLAQTGGAASGAGASGTDGGRETVRVTVATPQRAEVTDSAEAIGTIHPVRAIGLRPLASGRVSEVAVTSGERVEEGDLIVALDARAARASVARAEATRDEARSELARIEELSEENVAAEARLEEARAAAARAEAELEQARAALEDRRLTAPFDGTLGIVTADRGEYVDPSTTLAPLDDLSVVEVAFDLPEDYYARVEPGQRVDLATPVYPDRAFTGTVSVRGATIAPASRSFEVRARLDNPGRRLAGGMFVEAEIVFDRAEALTVPDDAIVSEGETTFVFTVADGTARRTEIGVGESVGNRTEVTRGLREDDRVVLTGWDDLSDGAAVTVADGAPQEALR